MRPELAAAVHAAAELLPVSSSAHLRAAGADGTDDVAAHLVPLAVALVVYHHTLPTPTGRRMAFHAVAGGIPSIAGVLMGDRRHRLPAWMGMLAGAGVLASTARTDDGRWWRGARRRGGRARTDVSLADGAWLGAAQAAALWPGMSRLGTTLAVARWRGFAADEAPLLAREVGVPVTVGALAYEALRGSSRAGDARASRPRLLPAVVGAVAAVPLARRVDRGGSLAPYVLERIGLALVMLRQSRPA